MLNTLKLYESEIEALFWGNRRVFEAHAADPAHDSLILNPH